MHALGQEAPRDLGEPARVGAGSERVHGQGQLLQGLVDLLTVDPFKAFMFDLTHGGAFHHTDNEHEVVALLFLQDPQVGEAIKVPKRP